MNCLIASEEMIKKYPDLVRDVVYFHTQVNKFIAAYPEEAAVMAEAILKVNKQETLEAYYLTPNFCPVIAPNTIQSCLSFVDTLMKAGYILKPLTKDDIFNTTFIQEVHPSACTERVGKVAKDPALFEFITGKKA